MKSFVAATLVAAASLGFGPAFAQAGEVMNPSGVIANKSILGQLSSVKLDMNLRKGESFAEYRNRVKSFCKNSAACSRQSKNLEQYVKCMDQIMP